MINGQLVLQAVNDRANPVVVKELRQAVQSRLVVAILLLFLLANVLTVGGFLLFSADISTNEHAGQDLFDALFVVLVCTCIIFVPLYAAVRLTMERNDSNIDLLFITTIAPAAIIRGKFWAALALTALIYSASTPFLTLTYLLRGIDLPSIFFALGMAFLATALTIMLGIFAGSVAGGLLLRLIMFGILLAVGFGIMTMTVEFGLSMAQRGLASMFLRSGGWLDFGAFLFLMFSAWGLFYLLSVAAISARSSNRMFPVRVFATISWAVFGAIMGILALNSRTYEPVMVWAVVSSVILAVGLNFILGERESWSPRVRRSIPRHQPLRFLAWLFYTGSAGGVLWCCALSGLTLLAAYATIGSFTYFTGIMETDTVLLILLGVLLFSWCYSMSGLFVRRMVAPRSVPLLGTTLGLVLMGLGGTIPLLVAYMINGPNWQFDSLPVGFVLANPFVLGRTGSDRFIVYCFLFFWAFLGLLINLPWFRDQWREFRRHEPKPIPPSTSLAAEPSVVHV